MQEPRVAQKVIETDNFRLEYIMQLFADMGFTGYEKEVRARNALAFLVMHGKLMDDTGDESPEDSTEIICRIFCGEKPLAGG